MTAVRAEAPTPQLEDQRDVAPARRRGWRRPLLSYLVTVFFLVTLNFFLPRAMPGDPITALQLPSTPDYVRDVQTRQALTRYYGLDRPVVEQYGHYLKALVHGDLGVSIQHNAPVAGLLKGRLAWTALLMGSAMALATTLGIVAGLHSGWRRGRPVDRRLLTLFLGTQNFPVFFLASLALLVFAVQLGWVPLAGGRTPFSGSYSVVHQVADIAHHLVLPASVMAVELAGYQYLVMRASMVGELGSDYLVLGRAKGLRERSLKYRYAARNALLPAVSVVALQLSRPAVAGAIFVETVFAYPGLGQLMSSAIAVRDYPTLQGCLLVLSLVVVTANLLADLAYARLDPRTTA